MEPYVHKKDYRLVEERIPPNAPICYLTLRAEAVLDRTQDKKELYKLLRLIRKKALRMESRLRQYRKAIENLGFRRESNI
jgi:hypothetical protein